MAGTNKGDVPQRRLGRGLSSLIPSAVPVVARESGSAPGARVGTEQPGVVSAADAGLDVSGGSTAAAAPGGPGAVVKQPAVGAESRSTPVGAVSGVVSSESGVVGGGGSGVGGVEGKSAEVWKSFSKRGKVIDLSVIEVCPGKFQPRRRFDDEGITELAASIRAAGMVQPVVVREVARDEEEGDDEGGGSGGGGRVRLSARYELIAGERRWRAARIAGMARIPAVVVEVDDATAAQWALIENLQREDLRPMDRAWALRRLADGFGLTHQEVARRIGMERVSVTNTIRLTELEEDIQSLVDDGKITVGHAKVLLGMAAGKTRCDAAKRAAESGWSVRQLEERVGVTGPLAEQVERGTIGGLPAGTGSGDAIHDLEVRLSKYLSTRVKITTGSSRTRGTLRVSFYNLDHFDEVVRRMGYREEVDA